MDHWGSLRGPWVWGVTEFVHARSEISVLLHNGRRIVGKSDSLCCSSLGRSHEYLSEI